MSLGTTATCGAGASSSISPLAQELQSGFDLQDIPNFCSHEHWGSITALGMVPEGFRADVEAGAFSGEKVSLFDILLDPYFTGNLHAAGDHPGKSINAGPAEKTWERLRPMIARQQLTGTFQCIRRGVSQCYGIDIAGAFDIGSLNDAIAKKYAQQFQWYRQVMRDAHFSALIRPVHPEFYARRQTPESAQEEAGFTRTVMRIDPLLDFWKPESPRRDFLKNLTGIEPRDAESWHAFLEALFEVAAKNGACGIKQLQAYSRSLDFPETNDTDVVWRGDLKPEQVQAFQDWVVNECCRLAGRREWPHQVHVGTHNLEQSSPLPLAPLARRHPGMKIVMLHCWPFLDESGWLAKHHDNIYLDTCWQPVLNPQIYADAMSRWMNYVPTHKIMCAHDSTSIEMAVGSAQFTREILARTLSEKAQLLGLNPEQIRKIAADYLHNNAVRVYGIS